MPEPRFRLCPGVEGLDARILLAATHLVPGEYPSADARRTFTTADLQTYAAAYETTIGEPGFTPQYDFNGTGFIGQNDATPILRGLTSITPRKPLTVTLRLETGEQVTGSIPANSGGTTTRGTVTVIGKTTPNSIIFTDGPSTNSTLPLNNYKFQGIAVLSNSQGEFKYTEKLNAEGSGGSLTTTTILIRTPFGQQLIHSFPIRRLP
jgi:hypothetical protein